MPSWVPYDSERIALRSPRAIASRSALRAESRNGASLRLELKLGGSAGIGPSARLGIEAHLLESTLEGAAERFDEEAPRVRLYLKVPR